MIARDSLADLGPGDLVLFFDATSRRGPRPVKVIKVGRKLVHCEIRGSVCTFLVDGGRRNDGYGHSFIRTEHAHAAIERRTVLFAALRTYGLTFTSSGQQQDTDTATLERVLAALAPQPPS